MWGIREELMKRYGMTETEAEELIKKAKEELHRRIAAGEDISNICKEYFGLGPDCLDELLS